MPNSNLLLDPTITSYFRIAACDEERRNKPVKLRSCKMSHASMNKEKWVALFRDIGLDDATMRKWHKAFEVSYPNEHQSFLEWLKIPEAEISLIRAQ